MMKNVVSFIVLVCAMAFFGGATVPTPGGIKEEDIKSKRARDAVSEYKKAVRAINEEAEKKKQIVRKKCLDELSVALKDVMKQYDLEQANAIDAFMKDIQADMDSSPDLPETKKQKVSIMGTYHGIHKSWQGGYLTFYKNGRFKDQDQRWRGTWSLRRDELTLKWSDPVATEKLIGLEGGKIFTCREYKFVLVKK